MQMVLIGEKESKRTSYMEQAASRLGVCLQLVSWEDLRSEPDMDLSQLKGKAVKIDPPAYKAVYLEQMQGYLMEYRRVLQKMSHAECLFLNTPMAVNRMLDKKEVKRRLQEQKVMVTQMFADTVSDAQQLLELMQKQRCYSVFLKPRYFSGAAGAAAFRIHPVLGKLALYTSCRLEGEHLVNTKKLMMLKDKGGIYALLNRLLALDCVIERWHPKADFHGKSYDLRVVYQFGHIAHIVARQSKGPITNLHLNNQALDIKALELDVQTLESIGDLCGQAVRMFEGLTMAGIDILLDKSSLKPRVIEMNGQGDLIYQDIYGENQIYREQVEKMCRYDGGYE